MTIHTPLTTLPSDWSVAPFLYTIPRIDVEPPWVLQAPLTALYCKEGVGVAGTGVAVGGCGTGVAVGGRGVAVGGTGVAVGGTGVLVGTGVAVKTGVLVGFGVGEATGVGLKVGLGVLVGVGVGVGCSPHAVAKRLVSASTQTKARPSQVVYLLLNFVSFRVRDC